MTMVNENGILIDESDPNYELYRDQAEELEEKKPKAKTIKEKTDTETQPKPIEPKSEPTGTIETGILGNAPSPKTKFIKEPDIDKVLSDKTPKPKIEGDPTEFEKSTPLDELKEINKGDRTPLTQANLARLNNERQKVANVKKVFE